MEKPKKVDADVVASWLGAADRRPPAKKKANMLRDLKLRNPVRVWRMQKDFAWAQRQLEKLGYDPEEIRWLL